MTKIGTEVAHVTHDLDTTFKVMRSKVNLQGRGILWLPPAQLTISATVFRLRNDLYCVEWDVKFYYTIPSATALDQVQFLIMVRSQM